MLLSICIPSYNRPESILQLLQSIDANPDMIEIVIAEDAAPLRDMVRSNVKQFKDTSNYNIHYHENQQNLGYDANIRNLIGLANGDFVLFMGD
ncbi:MAG: glycosyltransferase family 2 protein, partial [Sediminibacterium sp.]